MKVDLKTICLCWPTFLVSMLMCHVVSSSIDPDVLEQVLKDFIRVRGMKMDKYNFWWGRVSFRHCVRKCVMEQKFLCRSFSYSPDAEACSTYENDRATAPSVFYNPPGVHAEDPYGHNNWDYYERKSSEYRLLEDQVDRLKNLTEISVGEASSVLTSIVDTIQPTSTSSSASQSKGRKVSPSELEIAGQSLMLVMDLNPIEDAPLESIQEFTEIVANVSSALTDSSYASSWQLAQKNPSSPGSASIVTSAEQLTREVSAKLMSDRNASLGVSSEADSVGFWMDFEYGEENLFEKAFTRSIFRQNSAVDFRSLDESLDDSSFYIFPKRQLFSASTFGPTVAPNNGSNSSSTTLHPVFDEFFQDTIILPREALGSKSMVTNVRYKNLKDAMPTRCTVDKQLPAGKKLQENIVNSAVLTTSIYPRPRTAVFKDKPVIIIFKHDREPKQRTNISTPVPSSNNTTNQTGADEDQNTIEENILCVFWQEGLGENIGGSWSTDGCSVLTYNSTHTVCNCSHLTSFAVLLQIVDYDTDDLVTKTQLKILSIISKVGCILSLLGVTIMCAAFIKLKLHTENLKIHFNLGIAVGLADIVFLFEEMAEQSKSGCIIVTILLYYFNMTVLAWMLNEGIHLYSQVVVVFVSARRWFKYYLIAGWGFPVILLAISMGTLNVQLGLHDICWLSPADNSIWAFAAPALVVIVINTIILITVVRVIIRIQPGKSNHMTVSKLRNAVKGSVFLFPLLGTTWLFGLLSLSQETLLFQYLFTITNSLQGFFLFVFHCLCNSEVREDARRHKWFSSSKSFSSHQSPHLHHSHFSFNVTSGLRRLRSSVSETPTSSSVDSDINDTHDISNRNFGKFLNLFPKKFAAKLPATIVESEEKYEKKKDDSADSTAPLSQPSSTPFDDSFNMEISSRILKPLPLPGMPVKNDQISPSIKRFGKRISVEEQVKLNEMLAKDIANNALKDLLEKDQIKVMDGPEKKVENADEHDQKENMGSYDSGLNSIDNESILDEDDETWMANQKIIDLGTQGETCA